MKKVVRIKENELVTLIDKIITETTKKQKISEGVRKKKIIKEGDDEDYYSTMVSCRIYQIDGIQSEDNITINPDALINTNIRLRSGELVLSNLGEMLLPNNDAKERFIEFYKSEGQSLGPNTLIDL